MKMKITADWVKKNSEYFGFDLYGFAVYKYRDLFITVDESDGEILAIEFEGV